MQFSIKDAIPFPRERVFSAQRDQMSELAAYLNDIESITVKEREDDGHISKLVNLWIAGGTDIPAAARAFVKPEMLRWTDYATWNQEEWTCDWNLVLGFLQEAVSVSGTTSFAEVNDRTTVTIAGDITIKADKIPGVPRFMAGKIGPVVEKFVINLIRPNLKKTNEGIRSYLRDQA
jgi:uncharacterized protein YndB with AHSA1/START domain